nr:oxidoreductase [Streptomyces albus]
MAAGLGLRTLLVEADRIGGKVARIGALDNVPGGWRDGAPLADALAADVARLVEAGCCALVPARAVRVTASEDRAETTLQDGRVLSASAVLVATGVTAPAPGEVAWIDAPAGLRPPPLWRAAPEDVGTGYPAVVLGADRPLGTWLRAHPSAAVRLDVLHPPGDSYKTEEVAHDSRVRLSEAERVTVVPEGDGHRITVRGTDGGSRVLTTHRLLANLGSRPAPPDGDLVAGPDGYCPPGAQLPRLLTAGDLRSARYQRIVTAQGSGAEAVLAHYYAARGLTGPRSTGPRP